MLIDTEFFISDRQGASIVGTGHLHCGWPGEMVPDENTVHENDPSSRHFSSTSCPYYRVSE